MKNKFKFVLSNKLKALALYSSAIVFTAEKSKDTNLFKISWEENGELESSYYDIEEVFDYVNSDSWVLVEF